MSRSHSVSGRPSKTRREHWQAELLAALPPEGCFDVGGGEVGRVIGPELKSINKQCELRMHIDSHPEGKCSHGYVLLLRSTTGDVSG